VISVILCTHNPRTDYLERTLGSLRSQTMPQDDWELLIVDNASEKRIDRQVDVSWHRHGRAIRENELGLTRARLRGIREARGDVLVFVDDDNVLATDYLREVRRISDERAFLGAWSGRVDAEFEEAPPAWTRRYWGLLVIRDVPRDVWSNIYSLDVTHPLGAGLCIRRSVAREYARLHDQGLRKFRMDRAGTSLLSGGDNDLAACAIDIGLSCGVVSSLRLTHLIPRQRVTEDYLIQLVESVSYSGVILQSFRAATRNDEQHGGLVSRVADVLRRGRMSARERRFHDAARRGQRRARKDLQKMQGSEKHSLA
jgi:hypothetical protein